MDIVKHMRETAKQKHPKIIVCEGWDERCLRATELVLNDDICDVELLGDPATIKKEAEKFGVDISKAAIVDINDEKLIDELVPVLVEVRKHKGMDEEKARKLLKEPSYFGCTYTLAGKCDGVAGSAICSTAELMRPALQILRKKGQIVSEVFVLSDPDGRVLITSDGSMNIEPTPEQLAYIGGNAATAAKLFGMEPRVAFLSFSTKGSGGDNPQTEHVREAVKIFKEKFPDIVADGEMQFDAAVNPKSANRKCPDSPIQGDANVLITPNLNVGNILAHSILEYSKLNFDCGLVEGMQKPVTIIGRSVPLKKVEGALIATAMQV